MPDSENGQGESSAVGDPVARAIKGIRELQQIYMLERLIFLGGGVLSLLFATAIGVRTMATGEADLSNMLPLLGSGGAFMTTGFGSMFYFGKSFDLLRELAVANSHG